VLMRGAFDDFFRAVKLDEPGPVAELLQRGFDPNAHNEAGQSALTLAANEGSMRVIDTLLPAPAARRERTQPCW